MPKENEKDLEEIPKSVAKELTFYPVAHVDEVLKLALCLDNPEAFYEKARTSHRFDLAQVIRISLHHDSEIEPATVQ